MTTPNEIGIRASMPGGKPQVALLMRFRVSTATSPTAAGGGARRRLRLAADRQAGKCAESGWSFEVAGEGQRILRGVVLYRWMRNGRAAARAAGDRGRAPLRRIGADPADFSAATCRITSGNAP